MRRVHLSIASVLLTVLMSCGTQNPPENDTVLEASAPAPSDVVAPPALQHVTNKLDWLDAIELFAQEFPTYGGYAFNADRSQLIIYTSDSRSNRATRMHDAFVALIDSTTGFPEATDHLGGVVRPGNLAFTYSRVTYPLSKVYRWRVLLRDLMGLGLVNKI